MLLQLQSQGINPNKTELDHLYNIYDSSLDMVKEYNHIGEISKMEGQHWEFKTSPTLFSGFTFMVLFSQMAKSQGLVC